MNKYRDKSDFEINKAVAEKSGKQFSLNGELVFVKVNIPSGIVPYSVIFDPCNNPTDAMPIIIENKISMVRVNNEWSARQFNNHCIEVNDSNYYRAAMICFLMMKNG